MRAYRLDHLSDAVLLRSLTALVARERATTAELVAHIAEVDARRLYAPAGYASMHAYCVGELHLSEEAAFKRIHAARTARRFPEIFVALAEGRLHLSAVIMLAPYLTRGSAGELLAAAAHKTRSELERLLALRFPRTEALPLVTALPTMVPGPDGQVSPGQGAGSLAPPDGCGSQHAPGRVDTQAPDAGGISGNSHAPGRVAASVPAPKLAPIAPGRFVLQLTIDQDTHEMLRHAQALLGHQVPSGDLAEVLKRALGLLVTRLERRKFAKTEKPRPRRHHSKGNPRHIPAPVKRAVWERDGGQCTFVGDNGHRCAARRFLEFDHVQPVARGGEATVAGVRLRCRMHNQLEAERAFGAGFMNEKREAAKRMSAARALPADADDHIGAVMAALRSLGVRGEEARHAVERSEVVAGATLEERVRAALKCLWPRGSTRRSMATSSEAAA